MHEAHVINIRLKHALCLRRLDDIYYTLSEIALSINSEMKNVTEWLRNNMLTLNATKTNYMIMTTQGKRYNNDECKIIIDESIIDCVSNTKFVHVCIMLDDKLSWKLHINHICNKVSKAIGILVKARRILGIDSLVTLHNTICHIFPIV